MKGVTEAWSLNGRHRGETIFIVGAGPQLSSLTAEALDALAGRITIGLNRTTYKLEPTYFLSAYIGQVLLAQMTTSKTTLLHMRPEFEPPLAPGIVPLKRQVWTPGRTLHSAFSPPAPVLWTRRNVALGATHLALILGAREIVYVGVEQQNAAHFFNYEPDLLARMRADVERLRGVAFLNVDHPYSTYEALVAKLDTAAEEEEAKPFYELSHKDTFAAYFEMLGAYGVHIRCTAQASVTLDAGADFVELSDLVLNR